MLSVLTPLHAPGNAFVRQAWDSLRAQSHDAWHWTVLENHGGQLPSDIASDPRVTVHRAPDDLEGVGALKACLSELASWRPAPGQVELDADDLLEPLALQKVDEALALGGSFVYSDFAEFQEGGGLPEGYPYGARFGWRHVRRDNGDVVMRAPPVTAHNIRLVYWAPNHVRAWSLDAYRRVGGHNPALPVGDDHELIVRFFLEDERFVYVPHCLYRYRVHGGNTVRHHNAAIRAATWAIYNKAVWRLAEKWADDKGLLKVDLCGATDAPPGYLVLDAHAGIRCNLERRWPLSNSSVGLLRAHDAVEHLKDPVHTMNEAWRVLAPGGWLMIHVPSSNGQGAFCDPTHKSFWNALSFRYYTDPAFARYLPALQARFQVSRVLEWYPSEWHKENRVPYVEAHLFAVKPGCRPMGELLWPE